MYVVGIMSGSSLDGLDIALCRFEQDELSGKLSFDLLNTAAIPFEETMMKRLGEGASLGVRSLKKLEVDLSRYIAESVNQFLDAGAHTADYISCHGHTILHVPEDGYTVQIGQGAIISELTGLPCICDLRSSDMAVGGQGAPVAPIVEQILFSNFDFYINLGGIANVSYHSNQEVISWDSVPCNQILNHYASQKDLPYDDGGSLAGTGRVDRGLKEAWMSLPYFEKPYPKSMDNTWVRKQFLERSRSFDVTVEDALATMVDVCVSQIRRDIKDHVGATGGQHLRKCLITGGGAHNTFLVSQLSEALTHEEIEVIKPEDDIVDYKEAILMALMGFLRIEGKSNTISSVTGARTNTIGGAVYVPSIAI